MGMDWHRSSLNEESINAATTPYWRVRVINETASTQSDLANFINTGKAQSGEVFIAEYQSAGRGRLDRSFIAPPKSSLLFSLYLENEIDLTWLPLIAGIAICNVISETKLKWPNDIQIDDKKCGGILAEKVANGVIIGIGLNVYQVPDELPIPDATSLSQHGFTGNRDQLLIAILQELGKLIRSWPGNKKQIKDRYLSLSSTIGKSVEATLPNGEIVSGIAKSITDSGELVIGEQQINVGDIRHLR